VPDGALINSTTGEKDKLSRFMELAAEYGAALVGLTMDEQGIPLHAVGRVAIAKRILDYGESHGIPGSGCISTPSFFR